MSSFAERSKPPRTDSPDPVAVVVGDVAASLRRQAGRLRELVATGPETWHLRSGDAHWAVASYLDALDRAADTVSSNALRSTELHLAARLSLSGDRRVS